MCMLSACLGPSTSLILRASELDEKTEDSKIVLILGAVDFTSGPIQLPMA